MFCILDVNRCACLCPVRSVLMAELEKEEKEKDWYYAQLQNLTKRIDSLPLTENVSVYLSSSIISVLGYSSQKPYRNCMYNLMRQWSIGLLSALDIRNHSISSRWLFCCSCLLLQQFSLQTDMTRRQLEYEARQIRAAMEEQLGTCQDMEKRAQVRREG